MTNPIDSGDTHLYQTSTLRRKRSIGRSVDIRQGDLHNRAYGQAMRSTLCLSKSVSRKWEEDPRAGKLAPFLNLNHPLWEQQLWEQQEPQKQ
jgi:hypothetical protein